MQIYPVSRELLHSLVLEPFAEGCEFINLCWQGKGPPLEHKVLDWKERVIYLIQGILLLLPLINTIIWIAWKTFGDPPKLVDPYRPEAEALPITYPTPPSEVTPDFEYEETAWGNKYRTSWAIETYPHMTTAIQTNLNTGAKASSRYHSDGSLQEFHYQLGPKKIDLTRIGTERRVRVQIADTGLDRTIELPENHHWMMQAELGLKSFVLSNETTLLGCVVVPEYPPRVTNLIPESLLNSLVGKPPLVATGRAMKKGLEEVLEFPGKSLQKVEIRSTHERLASLGKGEFWFDPTTGDLKKWIASGEGVWSFLPSKTAIFVQNRPSPG